MSLEDVWFVPIKPKPQPPAAERPGRWVCTEVYARYIGLHVATLNNWRSPGPARRPRPGPAR
jgi:hypothetical protein